MHYSGTDPESYITEHTLVYKDISSVSETASSVSNPDPMSSEFEPNKPVTAKFGPQLELISAQKFLVF